MLVLGIESSCDETAAAIVEDGRVVHSNVIASQIGTH
ncbi:MAG: tRNA (adenosine(37)-N6)-threonylcarbamoyltransferase complex transferase subunit TsaD, partial [Acidobacteria bacterium]|nr:tRNA (adenosine(37)-N6)-threonylcarbamoyltransferase complex transferase subunit TsaD [Acidobacteriota bacterium]